MVKITGTQAKNLQVLLCHITIGSILVQVELLVMKALSEELVAGRIDEVEQLVSLTWVQPRVLDRDQLLAMTRKIESWANSVNGMEVMIENKAGEILTY